MKNIVYQDDQSGYAVAEKRIDFAYDATSRYATITYYKDTDGGAGNLVMTATYAYDDTGRLTDLDYADATPATIRDFEWTYDEASRIVGHDSDVAVEDVTAYTHDDTNQLTAADYTTGSDESYTYDENGNRVTANGDSYETGDNNQTTSDDTYAYQYDEEGNLSYRYVDEDSSETLNTGDTEITEYSWDHRNRMTDVAHKAVFGGSVDWTAEYIYDAFNHRIGALYDTDGDSALDLDERYVWQGKNVCLDFIDSDGDGGGESLDLTNRYLWGQAVDQLLAQETYDDGGVEDVLYPATDNLGSVRSLVDYLGDITATYSYDSFGNITVQAGSITDIRYLYTCQEYDLTTGFYYYDARWYDLSIGKFISEDPIVYAAGDANLYRYCFNNPVIYVDPTGQAWEYDPFKGHSFTPDIKIPFVEIPSFHIVVPGKWWPTSNDPMDIPSEIPWKCRKIYPAVRSATIDYFKAITMVHILWEDWNKPGHSEEELKEIEAKIKSMLAKAANAADKAEALQYELLECIVTYCPYPPDPIETPFPGPDYPIIA